MGSNLKTCQLLFKNKINKSIAPFILSSGAYKSKVCRQIQPEGKALFHKAHQVIQSHQVTVFVLLKWFSYQNGEQQSHVSTTEDGKKHSVHHQQDVGSGQRGQQVDEATEDQVGFMIVVFVEEVPVCHPARHQLSDGFCDTCIKECE